METTNLKRHISEVSAHFDSIKIVKLFDFVLYSDYSEVEHHTRDIHSLYQEATNLHKHLMKIENGLRELYHIEVGKKFKDVIVQPAGHFLVSALVVFYICHSYVLYPQS